MQNALTVVSSEPLDFTASGHLGFAAGSSVIEGHAILDLPLFLALGTPLPLGGSTEDENADGIGDHVLHIQAGFNNSGLTGTTVSDVSLAGTFDIFAFLNDPENVLRELEGIVTGLKDGLLARLDQIGLPLIDDKLKDAAGFIDNLRDRLLGIDDADADVATAARYDTSGLGYQLLPTTNPGMTTIDLIKQALFNALGTLLVVPNLDANGNRQYDANGNLLTRASARSRCSRDSTR
jgi:hypothetical protein